MKTHEELAKQYAIDNAEIQCEGYSDKDCFDCFEHSKNFDCMRCHLYNCYMSATNEATRWRSVKKGLPKDAGRYMVKYNNDFIDIANIRFFNEDMNKPYFEQYSQIGDITHWRPIY